MSKDNRVSFSVYPSFLVKRFTNERSDYDKDKQTIESLLVYRETTQHTPSNGGRVVPLRYLIDHFNDQISQNELRFLPDRPLVLCNGRVVGRFATVLLTSAFQPIVCARDPDWLMGHEALLRAYMGNNSVAPRALFTAPRSPLAIVHVDRLCRIVHMLNYLAERETHQGLLWLNVGTEHLLSVPDNHGWYFEQVLQRCGLAPQHIVIDVPASAIQDPHAAQVHTVLANYRARGYRIAIEGLHLSRDVFDFLWWVPADIVKVDVESLLRADKNQRRRLHRLVEHTAIEIIATGIETLEHARAARAVDVHGLQGFYFGAPEESLGRSQHWQQVDGGILEAGARTRFPPLVHARARVSSFVAEHAPTICSPQRVARVSSRLGVYGPIPLPFHSYNFVVFLARSSPTSLGMSRRSLVVFAFYF